MTSLTQDRAVAAWLRRLSWALGSLPARDREDIVAETVAHLEEAAESGRPLQDCLAGFGEADAYARRFLDELARALGGQKTSDLVGAVVARAHRSLVAALAGGVLLLLGMAVLTALTLAVMEIQDPAHTGLWLGPHVRFIGQIDDPAGAVDLLGGWLLPAAAAVIGLAWVVGRLVLLAAVRSLARPR